MRFRKLCLPSCRRKRLEGRGKKEEECKEKVIEFNTSQEEKPEMKKGQKWVGGGSKRV